MWQAVLPPMPEAFQPLAALRESRGATGSGADFQSLLSGLPNACIVTRDTGGVPAHCVKPVIPVEAL